MMEVMEKVETDMVSYKIVWRCRHCRRWAVTSAGWGYAPTCAVCEAAR